MAKNRLEAKRWNCNARNCFTVLLNYIALIKNKMAHCNIFLRNLPRQKQKSTSLHGTRQILCALDILPMKDALCTAISVNNNLELPMLYYVFVNKTSI